MLRYRLLVIYVMLVAWLPQVFPSTQAAPIVKVEPPDEERPNETNPSLDLNRPDGEKAVAEFSNQERMKSPAIDAAQRSLRANNIRECLAHLKLAIEENPSLPPDLLLLAQLYASQNRFREGQTALENAAAHYKDHPEVYQTLGALALAQNRVSDAWVHFEKALNLPAPASWSPEQENAFRASCFANLNVVAQRRRDWQSAETMLASWAELAPSDSLLLKRWAKTLMRLGRDDDALAKLAQAHRLDASLNRPELAMAAIYTELEKLDQAKKWYEKALEEHPDDGRAHFEYAGHLLIVGMPAEARKHLETAVQTGANLKELGHHVPLMLGWIARLEKDYARAEQLFREALKLSPGDPTALYHLPLVLVEQSDESKRRLAQQVAMIRVNKSPQSSHARAALGWVQYRLGNTAEAEVSLKTAVALAGNNVDGETLYFLARVLLENSKATEATSYIRAAKSAINSPGLFILRDEARQWLDSIALAIE